MLSSSSSSGGSGQGSSSSSSFITSSSSAGSLHSGLLTIDEQPNSGAHHSIGISCLHIVFFAYDLLDGDGIYPPYILLDEDNYEETVESIRMASALSMVSETWYIYVGLFIDVIADGQ